ncbi:hypothetical protein K437DRAFT_270002 [Tilletiaria anomala UBC 951]|uniref:GOLD domain-containing protein n=1 Tax=Tilletiaria anomala (strain ATCC 24038 / CBS 436.72 / UBC 951) TaxID=1037660 RepID=A0A066VNM6_TILAU|nr:uncharacterized protein K437DRAFT_270002 [Tilletiaria anomala UBC 951]KDN40339.1 hypothetical protein K437DRAFT_270002 [Tilletiaria anomala UBC 951]
MFFRSFTCLLAALLIALCALPPSVSAAALTAILEPHEKSCYYAWVDQVGEKVGFYFAVQSGGNFEVAYSVHDPNDKLIIDGHKERQVDIIFTGNTVGEYVFCFHNDYTSYAEKLIDFDITVESEPRLEMPLSQTQLLSDHSAPLEESITKIGSELTSIARTQRFFRTRENRNYDTVVSTQSRIFWYSIVESLVIISMSVAQVLVVRFLFNTSSTKRYRV